MNDTILYRCYIVGDLKSQRIILTTRGGHVLMTCRKHGLQRRVEHTILN